MRLAPAVLIPALAALPLAAQAPSPASHDPSAVHPGRYRVEPMHTQVMFSVLHLGFSDYGGRFSGVSGTLTLAPRRPAADMLDITVPVASVSTTSAKLDGELKGGDWLDAGKYPDMRFRSTAVTTAGPGHALIQGMLTLHGVTRPMTLDTHFVGAGVNPLTKAYTVGFRATGTLRRSDFGVKTYVPLVGDAVTVTINAAFEQAA